MEQCCRLIVGMKCGETVSFEYYSMGIRRLKTERELLIFVENYNRMSKHGRYQVSDFKLMDVYIYFFKNQAIGGYAINSNHPIGILSDIPLDSEYQSPIDLSAHKVTETRAVWILNNASEIQRILIYCWSVYHATTKNTDYVVGAVLNKKHLATQSQAYYGLYWSGVSKPFGDPLNVWVLYGKSWIVLARLPYALILSVVDRLTRKIVKTYHRKKRSFKKNRK